MLLCVRLKPRFISVERGPLANGVVLKQRTNTCPLSAPCDLLGVGGWSCRSSFQAGFRGDVRSPSSLVETMLWPAFAQVLRKGTKRPPDLFARATARRPGSHMLQQLHHLNRRIVPAEGFPQVHQLLQNNIRGAPAVSIFEPNWTIPHCFSTLENLAGDSMDCQMTKGVSFDQRFATLRSIGDCVNHSELRLLLKKKSVPVCYVWCDPSPQMHITQGISMTINVNKMIKAGCEVKILMADWFARMDRKIGFKVDGDLSKMHNIGLYNIETWKASGMDLDRVEFVWLSDGISCNADEYWPLAMEIARKSDMGRIKKWLRVRATKDTRGHGSCDPYRMRDFTPAEIFYPCLQCASMLSQKADVWLLGLDQCGAHTLATQYCNRVERKNRPVALFHNVLPNLLEYPEHTSCDDSRWAIFMEDDEQIVSMKIEDAFCPPENAEGNPCLEYIRCIILPWFGKFEVVRKEENGGNKTFISMEELTADYETGALHPVEVKEALVKAINMMLQTVRDRFRSSTTAKKLAEEMEEYKFF